MAKPKAEPPYRLVQLDTALHKRIKEYARKSGMLVRGAIDRAVEEFLRGK